MTEHPEKLTPWPPRRGDMSAADVWTLGHAAHELVAWMATAIDQVPVIQKRIAASGGVLWGDDGDDLGELLERRNVYMAWRRAVRDAP